MKLVKDTARNLAHGGEAFFADRNDFPLDMSLYDRSAARAAVYLAAEAEPKDAKHTEPVYHRP
jgi:hypothetical protein